MDEKNTPERWLLINSLVGGGAERQATLLLQHQVFDNIILLEDKVEYKDIDHSKIIFLTRKGIKKDPLQTGLSLFVQYKRLKQLIRERPNHSRPLQIVSMLFRADLLNYFCSRSFSYPLIISFRSFISGFPKSSLPYIGWKIILKHSTHIVPNSSHCGFELVKLGFTQPERITIIQNGYDIESIHEQALINQAINNISKKYIVAAGRLGEVKGYFFLVSVFAHFYHSERQAVSLVICGKGPLMTKLIQYAQSLDLTISFGDDFSSMKAIHFAGFQQNIYPILHKAALFIMSSIFEGLPNVVAESLICGTPVVCSANTGTIELLAPQSSLSSNSILKPLEVQGGYLMPAVYEDRPATLETKNMWLKILKKMLAQPEENTDKFDRFPIIAENLSAEKCAASWTKLLDEIAALKSNTQTK